MGLLQFALALSLLAASPEVDTAQALCAPQFHVTHPAECPALGPGQYVAQLAAARLPAAIPELPLVELTRYDPVVDFTYARVTTPDAPLFATPADGVAGVVAETTGRGFIYVSVTGPVVEADQSFYRTRSGHYIRAADVDTVKVTNFQGAGLAGAPLYPFGWVVANKVLPSRMPGADPPPDGPVLYRRAMVQIFAEQRIGDWNWYLIGPNQWIEQRAISKVNFNPPPEGVSGKWIQVDLYEQTMVAYEDHQPIYATLVSSGLDRWATEPGLFHIWARLKVDGMSGTYEPDGSDYYSLEAVPWVMYFDGPKALHGQYWHDRLGYKRSHGCVNLAPQDARWLFEWSEKGTPVWVYDPSGKAVAGAGGGSAP